MRRLLVAVAVLAALATLATMSPGSSAQSGGAIRGRVMLQGPAPGNTVIRMGMDPKCSELNAGKRVLQETAVVARDGGTANAFIYLEGRFPATPVPSAPVVIDQRSCLYGPRVVGMRVGQGLRVVNHDALFHNVHSSSAVGNSFNTGQPKAGMAFDYTPKAEEHMLKLGCDVHSWMTAYVGVMSHPYFAVSSATGAFEIGKIPPGSYTIHAWHERFGEMKKSVTIKPGTPTVVDFAYSPSPSSK